MKKGRLKRHLRRKKPSIMPYDRVLVVCEGSKTEPQYLNELLSHCRLSTANIEVLGAGVDPVSLVKRALKRARLEIRGGDPFDRVYCVFDRNSHANFHQASDMARHHKMRLARSWPCFEFWLLLHFRYMRSPYSAQGQRSPGQICVSDLSSVHAGYSKGGGGAFLHLLPKLDSAIQNARQTRVDAQRTGEDNPSTEFHELVEYLQSLARH